PAVRLLGLATLLLRLLHLRQLCGEVTDLLSAFVPLLLQRLLELRHVGGEPAVRLLGLATFLLLRLFELRQLCREVTDLLLAPVTRLLQRLPELGHLCGRFADQPIALVATLHLIDLLRLPTGGLWRRRWPEIVRDLTDVEPRGGGSNNQEADDACDP